MENVKFKVTVKELNGGVTTSKVTLDSNNDFSFETSSIGGKVKVSDIDSGTAPQGTVITSNGSGGAAWEAGSGSSNLISITSTTGTLTPEELELVKKDVCFIKLTINNEMHYFRKHQQTATNILFSYVVENTSEQTDLSTTLARQHIDIIISSGDYSLEDGELINTYNKDQIDNNFAEVEIEEE